ncbi:MAG: hypothetical protein ABI867_43220 [Kofleriaceae bacterium]
MRIPAFVAVWRLPPERLLRGAAVLTLFALGLMVWSMLDPTVLPVMLAMSLGQLLGTFAFLLYGIAVLRDVLRLRRERKATQKVEL